MQGEVARKRKSSGLALSTAAGLFNLGCQYLIGVQKTRALEEPVSVVINFTITPGAVGVLRQV